RKLISIISIITFSVIIVGCSAEGSDSKDKVSLDLFNIKVETSKQLESLAEEYESENPEVDINITTVGGGQDAESALQSKFSSGEEPSIFLISGLSDVEKYQDKLLDVSEMESAKTAIEGTLEGVTLDDTPYGIPINSEVYGWMINKDLFKQAGIDPDDISSYDDFVESVKTLDDKKEELGMDEVFAFTGKEDWVVSQFSAHFSAPEFNNDLNEVYNSDTIEYEYGDRMKEYVDLINEYSVQPIVSLEYSAAVEELFMNGKVAMVHQGNWIVPTLDSMDPSFSEEKLGILPFYVDDDTEGKIAAGPPWYWAVNKTHDDEVVEESKKFIDWMYTSEEGKRYITEEFGYIPSHEGFDLDEISDPVSKEVYEYMMNEDVSVWAHNNHPDGWFSESLLPEFQKYVSGDIDWDEFKSNTRKKFEEMR